MQADITDTRQRLKNVIFLKCVTFVFPNLHTIMCNFGRIKIASSEIETKEEIISRIKDVLHFIDKEQLIVAPDCGLGHLSRGLAKTKLKIMVDAAKSF